MIWIVRDVFDFAYNLCFWLVSGFISGVLIGCIGLFQGIDYVLKHRGFWIITSFFLGWYFSLHLSLMERINEFNDVFVTMANTTLPNSSLLLLDDVLKNTAVDPAVYSTLEVEDAAEFFGVEKNAMKVHLYYLVSSVVALCVILVILFITEFIYFRTFGGLIFGHVSVLHGEVSTNTMKEIKHELEKVRNTLTDAKHDTTGAFVRIIDLLRNMRQENLNALATIMDAPKPPMLEYDSTQIIKISSPDTTVTTQASEYSPDNSLEIDVDTPLDTPLATAKTKRRKTN